MVTSDSPVKWFFSELTTLDMRYIFLDKWVTTVIPGVSTLTLSSMRSSVTSRHEKRSSPWLNWPLTYTCGRTSMVIGHHCPIWPSEVWYVTVRNWEHNWTGLRMTCPSGHSECKKVVKNIKVTFWNASSVLFDVYQGNWAGYNDYIDK